MESLVVGKCGVSGSSTNIIAVDHDTGVQHVFTKFNGKATGITSNGTVPAASNGINHAAQVGFQFLLPSE